MSCMFQPQQLQGHKEGRGTALLGCVAISLHHRPRHPPPPQALLPLPKSKASSRCCSGHTALVGTFWLSTVYFSLEQTLLTPLLGKNEVRQMEVSQNPPQDHTLLKTRRGPTYTFGALSVPSLLESFIDLCMSVLYLRKRHFHPSERYT